MTTPPDLLSLVLAVIPGPDPARRIGLITVQESWGDDPTERLFYQLIVDYDAHDLITKVTQQFPDLPKDVMVSTDGVYDTYEYKEKLVIKHSLFRRANSATGPVTLNEYYMYDYNASGQIRTITRYVNRQLPPDGTYRFDASTVYRYSYTADNRIDNVKAYAVDRYGEENVQERYSNRVQYQYSQGNVSKQTYYSVYNKTEEKRSETRYMRYDDRKNPLYFPGHLTPGLLPVSRSVNNVLDVSHVGFNKGQEITDAIRTEHYEWVYDDNRYPTLMKETLVNQYIFITEEQTYAVQTRHGVSEAVFEYSELNNE